MRGQGLAAAACSRERARILAIIGYPSAAANLTLALPLVQKPLGRHKASES